MHEFPDSNAYGANMGPTWGRQDPGGPHVGTMNLAIWVAINNNFFGHEWGDLPVIFMSEEVTSENHRQYTSQVTKKLLFKVMIVLFYFLHAVLYLEHTIPLHTIIDRSFRHWRYGCSFLN